MTRNDWTIACLAAAPLLAGCPPTISTTTETSSGSEGETTESSTTSTTTDPTTGGSSTGDITTGTTTTTTTTTDPSTSSGSTTAMPGCANDDACANEDPNKPFCVDSQCVSCEGTPDPDAACAGADPALPVCDQAAGQCVVCTPDNKALCEGNTPVCDAATHECVGCSEAADCPDSACNVETGACFATDRVIYVDAAAQCDIGDGSMGAPFCQITPALDKIAMDDPSLGWTIKIKTGNYIQATLVVPDGSVLAIVGEGGIAKIRSTQSATLSVGTGSKVTLSKLNLASNADDTGLACVSGQIWGDELTFNLNRQGYVGTDCSAQFRRTVFYKNTSGALSSYGLGSTTLLNSYVSNNGSNADAPYGGLKTGQGHELHLIYTTVLNNLSEMGARSLQCDADAGPAEIRNSVIIAFVAPSIDCPTATFEHSAIDEGAVDGDTNLAAVMADAMAWFDPQVGGIYKAKPDSPISMLAAWKDGDPKADFNGDPRPQVADSPDYAGADRPAQ